MEDQPHNLDLWLCLDDYMKHLASEGADFDADDFTFDMDEALRWISGIGPNDERYDEPVTLQHLPSLAHVRSLMPTAEYRDPDNMMFGYIGFGDGDAIEGAA